MKAIRCKSEATIGYPSEWQLFGLFFA